MCKANPRVAGKFSGERVVVSGEQQSAVHSTADVLQHSVSNGIAIKGAGAAPQLIQHYQTVWSSVLRQQGLGQVTCKATEQAAGRKSIA